MKKLFALAISAVMVLSMVTGCGGKETKGDEALNKILEQGYITLATSPDFGPYEFQDLSKTGQDAIVGCEVDLAYYIADYIGVDLKINAMDFTTCQGAVSLGQADFSIAGYGYSDERAETYELSDYYQWSKPGSEDQCLITLKGSGANYTKPEDFAGKKVAAQNGSLQMNLITDQLKDIDIEPISSLNDGIMMVINGKVDALACATDTAKQFCENYDSIEITDFYLDYSSEGTIILVQKGQTALVEKVNEALLKAKEEGKFAEWKEEAIELCNSLGVEVH